MDIKGRPIWQQAAGDGDHDYSDLCLKWDVILNGADDDYGPWLEEEGRPQYLPNNKVALGKIKKLRPFCEQMKEGNLVVLRVGTRVIPAVGEIVGRYEYHEEFNDIDGWNLAHVRRVRWLWEGNKSDTSTLKLTRASTTKPLTDPDVTAWLKSLNIPDAMPDNTPKELPCIDDNDVSLDDISEYLFRKGVASDLISNWMNEIGEFVHIAKWYNRQEHKPSESETVSHLVVPLLRALGWTPQRMAIEWKIESGKIDVALFSRLPRGNNFLSVVVEAKKIGLSCFEAFQQAKTYALKSEHCRRIIVTDGLRYGVFTRNVGETPGEEDFSLFAYMNLTRLRREYPVYDCKGAGDALFAMSPEMKIDRNMLCP